MRRCPDEPAPLFVENIVTIIKLVKFMTKKPRRCERCGERFKPRVRGRPQRFCGASCRQAAYAERRLTLQTDPTALLARDLNHLAVRAVIRQELWGLLRQIGAVTDPGPPAPKDPRRDAIRERLNHAGLGHLLSSPAGRDRR